MRLIPATAAAALCIALAACGQESGADAQDTSAEPATETADAAPAESADAAPMMSTADVSPDAATLGDAAAPVTIVEYASTTCPHCAAFHATLFPHIESEWIETGRAKLIMRPLPTAPAQLAVAGFLLAGCAGEGEDYFDALGELFDTQTQMFEAAQGGDIQAYFEGVGRNHGVSPEELEQCFGAEEGLARIQASMDAAQADMVAGTPSFIINGVPYNSGELPDPASWDAALQAALDGASD